MFSKYELRGSCGVFSDEVATLLDVKINYACSGIYQRSSVGGAQVADWYSARLVIARLRVRIPPLAAVY